MPNSFPLKKGKLQLPQLIKKVPGYIIIFKQLQLKTEVPISILISRNKQKALTGYTACQK